MVAVLLLNASYEPLAVIPKRRALSLLLREVVDAATEEVVALSSAASTLEIPTVIRLRRYVNVPKRGASWSRRAVMRRDNFTCIYCGVTLGSRQGGRILRHSDFSVDHIVPKSRNGRNTWTNTACACSPCNNRKGNRLPHEAGMHMLWEPKTPRVDYLVASGNIPEAWKIYLQL